MRFALYGSTWELARLMGTMAQAHWRSGDAEAGWAGLERIRNTSEFHMEKPGFSALESHIWERTIFLNTFQAGLQMGALTDAQLASIPALFSRDRGLDVIPRVMEGEKSNLSAEFALYRENRDHIAGRHYSPHVVHTIANKIAVSMITDRQLEDNLALLHHRVDRTMRQFDPLTGVYRPVTQAAGAAEMDIDSSPGWFDTFYTKLADPARLSSYDRFPELVIKTWGGSPIRASELRNSSRCWIRGSGGLDSAEIALSRRWAGRILLSAPIHPP